MLIVTLGGQPRQGQEQAELNLAEDFTAGSTLLKSRQTPECCTLHVGRPAAWRPHQGQDQAGLESAEDLTAGPGE